MVMTRASSVSDNGAELDTEGFGEEGPKQSVSPHGVAFCETKQKHRFICLRGFYQLKKHVSKAKGGQRYFLA